MRYFFDTEFIEDGCTIDLISIGIVSEDGRTFYAINQECNWSKASDWVLENVLLPMGLSRNGWVDTPDLMSPRIKQEYLASKTKEDIAYEVLWFVKSPELEQNFNYLYYDVWEFCLKDKTEFWADYAAYDWVVLCQLFGKMIALPKSFPMFCNDLQQERLRLGSPKIEVENLLKHNALSDAIYVKKAWEFLRNYEDKLTA